MTARWNQQLELYLDDQLNEHERREFALRLNQDPQLREAVQLQHHIDQSLRRTLPVSPRLNADELLHQIFHSSPALDASAPTAPSLRLMPDPTSSTSQPRRSVLRALAVAALLFISIASIWTTYTYLAGSPIQRPPLPIDQYYQAKVQTGLKPYWVCENNDQFASAFRDRFNQPLLLIQPLPDGVTAAGLDYCNSLSPKTIAVLMRDQSTPIIILVDRASCPHSNHTLPADSNLHLHKRTLGDLILLEVSPLPHPRMLDLFYNPDTEQKSSAPGKWQQ
ncbi:MAG: hypothetical protein L0Y42_05200 [Phycisphaerales bacterium]|nr:hypothetical protein [Phycisphaerales bacterium]